MVDNLGDDGEGTSIRSDGEVDNSTDLDESLETFVLRMVSLLNLITSLTPPSMVCHSFQIFLRGETVSRKRPKKDFFRNVIILFVSNLLMTAKSTGQSVLPLLF